MFALLQQYGFVAIMFVVALGFPLLALGMAWIIRPKRPSKLKQSTYECGLDTIGPTWVQFKVQYYIYALIFVVFDVETVFLFPWAVSFKQLGFFALVEMFVFIAILVVGLAYAWRKGLLRWS
jgi:NADH:ubiquinone oxidoreductase subunit 3 (subunit A)